MRMARSLVVGVIPVLIALGGCATMDSVVTPATSFATAESAATAAERGYLDNVNTVSANAADAKALAAYASDHTHTTFALASTCIPTATRQSIEKILTTIDLYGKNISGLAGDTSYGNLSANANSLATDLSKLNGAQLADGKLPVADASAAIAAAQFVVNLVLDHQRYSDIKAAATNADKPLSDIVAALKVINGAYAIEFKNTQDGLETQLELVARTAPVEWVLYQQLLQEYRAAAAMTSDITQLNKTLDGLVTANKAIANAKPEDVEAAVQQFYNDANTAYTFYKSLPTK